MAATREQATTPVAGVDAARATPRLTLGPLQYFWPRGRVVAFYRAACDWPLDVVYLGETVCSKRRELGLRDWLALADEHAERGREVVLSGLALIESGSEIGALRRLVDNGRYRIEANDLSAVALCRERGLPFVGGPSLNVYNLRTLALLQADGLQRLVLGVEQSQARLAMLRAAAAEAGHALPELEAIAWGRLPLAWSARCFTARALDIGKDQCEFRCIDYPDGLKLATRDGQAFLRINGVQVQGDAVCDLAPELPALTAAGVSLLRLYPQADGFDAIVRRFRFAIDHAAPTERVGDNSGWWHAQPGMQPGP